MAQTIFSTANDIGGSGAGRKFTEQNFAGLMELASRVITSNRNFIVSGYTPTDGGGLNVNIAAGEAWISGYHVTDDASQVAAITDDLTDIHYYLQLTKTAGLVTGTQWVGVASPNPDGSNDPADSVKVFGATTASGDITGGEDRRRYAPGIKIGGYSGTGTSSRQIDLGFTPSWIMIWGRKGTGTPNTILSIHAPYESPTGFDSEMGLHFDEGGAGSDVDFVVADKERVPLILRKGLDGSNVNGIEVTVGVVYAGLNTTDYKYDYIAWT